MIVARILACTAVTAAVVACATGPRYDTTRYSTSITPSQAVSDRTALRGKAVLWGGLLVNSVNKKGATQLEILGYPLDSTQRPDIDQEPGGRFLAVKEGYLETMDYSQGRLVTVTGTLTELRDGKVGEAIYVYPEVRIDSVYLWPKVYNAPETHFQLGIGINVR
jgi:outer membrane lipoprotein